MGTCDTNKIKKKKTNKGKQPYCAPINDYLDNKSPNIGNAINASQIDLMSNNDFIRKKPSPLYKYNGTYYKKDEQTSIMTLSLQELQGNSLLTSKINNSLENNMSNNNSIYNTCIEEFDNESSSSNEVLEIINNGKMDENMIQKSTDKTTIDNYNEFIGNNEKFTKNNKVDIYMKKCIKNNNNNKILKINDKKDIEAKINRNSSSFNKLNVIKQN